MSHIYVYLILSADTLYMYYQLHEFGGYNQKQLITKKIMLWTVLINIDAIIVGVLGY